MGHRFDSPPELMTATINIIQQYRIKWHHDVYRQYVHRRSGIEHSENILKRITLYVCSCVRRRERHA